MAEPRAKKTSLACDSCRRRKRKCDGKTPVCSLCEKSNYECVYDATLDQRRPTQKNYVAALEARVAQLESILKNAGAGEAAGALDLETIEEGEPAPQDASALAPISAPAPIVSHQAEAVPSRQNEPEAGFVPSDDAAGALEAVSLVNPEEGKEKAQEPVHELDLGMSGYVPLVSLDAEHKLLAQFWDWQRMHLPYVAPVPFLSAYAIQSEAAHPNEPIPPPPPPPPPNPFAGPSAIGVPRAASIEPTADLVQFISPLLLDSMFAIAALFRGDTKTSETFYRRAETRVLHESANPRLATVQAALLMATWELGHARAPATWTLMGVACALSVRLGMNIDATPLVRRGVMSKRLFETRNFVFWGSYNMDRFSATCMGMHPLMDRRMVSTPRHSSLAAANVTQPAKSADEKSATSDTNVSWWDPGTLGMGDVIIQAGFEAIRDLVRMSDMLFDGIYAFNAPKRAPEEDLELVTRNNLTIQRFLDELPTWLRSTGVIKRKENGLVYLHLFTHLTSIVVSRPFLSPRPLSDEAMRIDATTDPAHPTHSSHIIRRYRTLAFRVARASALQITSLIRHIPLSSPCVTLPYVVYSACTILLLAPDDQAAMDGVRTGIAVLESMDETGYWVNSARDSRDRIQALATRWGVNIGSSRKVLGHVTSGGAGGSGGGGSGTGGSGAGGSGTGGRDPSEGDSNRRSNDKSTSATPSASNATGRTPPSASDQNSSNPVVSESLQDASCSQPVTKPTATSQPLEHASESSQVHANQWNDSYSNKGGQDQTGSGLPSYEDAVTSQGYGHPTGTQGYTPQKSAGYSGAGAISSGMVQPSVEQTYIPLAQPRTETYTHPQSQTIGFMPQHLHQPSYSGQQQSIQYQQQGQYQSQQPVQHVHYHFHSHTHQQPQQYHYAPSRDPYQPAEQLPHVAYALSHAEPQHDLHLPHTHWHQVLPPADPNLPFPPDPVACTDIAVCFADTVRTGQDPAFVQTQSDPYAGAALDWYADAQNSFAVITPDMYGDVGNANFGSLAFGAGGSGLYAPATPMGSGYGSQYGAPGGSYGGGYGMPGV
ncbi:hypothetical protein FRC12_011866 [Ceratobasidium sp. 428]|nr:hypothetical protein FRC12_011866 [Ceratobasidium sp. 428]